MGIKSFKRSGTRSLVSYKSFLAGNNKYTPYVNSGLIMYLDASLPASYAPPSIQPFRYIRWYANGSTANASTHFVELQALTAGGVNRALNLGSAGAVSQSSGSAPEQTMTNSVWQIVTDGLTDSASYFGFASGGATIQFDLGALYSDITTIKFWNYYADNRTYNSVTLWTSADGVTWNTIYGPTNTASNASGISVSTAINSSTWYDLSGVGNNVTLYNSPGYLSSNSGSVTFNGSNQYGAAPTGMANFTSGITVCALVNFGTANNWERIIDFGNGAPNNTVILARAGTTNTLHAEVLNGTATTFTHEVANTVQNSAWAFYSWTYDNATSTLGVNGTYYTQSNASSIANVTRSNNYIGRSNWSSDAYFDSGMSVVMVYNRALTQAEVTQNFNVFRTRYGI